jgi:hypothetical protein
MFSGCSGKDKKIMQYSDMKPQIKIEEYFNGPIKAWGLIQDRSGEVTTRFDVTMVGTWNGSRGTLVEKFDYYEGNEGKTTDRTWTIKKLGEDRYEGFADDIIGKATGKTSGNTVQWGYVMDIPVDGTTYRITLDDWMFLMNDGVLINRSYLKKFGFKVAELTLFMQKQDEK